jgi:membrane-associated phospholipid phosphatase
MNFEAMHHFEIQLMHHLQWIRSPWLDGVMLYLNLFDTMIFYYFLIVCAWYAYDRKTGIHLLFLYVLGCWVNQNMKDLFGQPRPFQMDPTLGLLSVSYFGFPSGAAQVMLALFGFLALRVQRAWFWASSIFFVLLIGFSRVYLGIHFPSDIVGGWIIGALLLFAYVRCVPSLERFLATQSRMNALLLCVASAIFLAIFSMQHDARGPIIGGFGASIGLLFVSPLPAPRCLYERIGRVALAFGGFFVLPLLLVPMMQKILPLPGIRAIVSFAWGLWVSGGVPYVCKLLALFKRAK